MLADLVERGGDDVRIAVGGGVRPADVARIVAETGAREVHLRAPGTVVSTGTAAGYDDGRRTVASATSSRTWWRRWDARPRPGKARPERG